MHLTLLLNPEVEVATPPSHPPAPTLLSQGGSIECTHVIEYGGANLLDKGTDVHMLQANVAQCFRRQSGATQKLGVNKNTVVYEAFEEHQGSDTMSGTDDRASDSGFNCVDEIEWDEIHAEDQQPYFGVHQHSFQDAADDAPSDSETSIYMQSPLSCFETRHISFQDPGEEDMSAAASSVYIQSSLSVPRSVEGPRAWLKGQSKSKFQADDGSLPVFQRDFVQNCEQLAAKTASKRNNKAPAKNSGNEAPRRRAQSNPEAEPKVKKSSYNMAERIAGLQMDPMVYSFTSTEVVCGGCKRRIKTDGRSLYYPGLFIKHRGRCVEVQKRLALMKLQEENATRNSSEG
ncbi:hypothetical protein C8R43DRAFT_1134144 [Mycena crocata]|nr:hypothetical protein C8R43DRAFT_1134144 [Mycena crocata]